MTNLGGKKSNTLKRDRGTALSTDCPLLPCALTINQAAYAVPAGAAAADRGLHRLGQRGRLTELRWRRDYLKDEEIKAPREQRWCRFEITDKDGQVAAMVPPPTSALRPLTPQ